MKRWKKILSKLYTFSLKLNRSVEIAAGAVVDYRAEMDSSDNIAIGRNSTIYKNVTLYKTGASRFRLGCCSHISSYTYMLLGEKNLIFGDNNAIAPFCAFYCVSNAIAEEKHFKDAYISGDIIVGDNVLIGSHSVVLPGTIIGNDVVIAANSVVKGTLASGYLYAGSPAKAVRKL